MTGAHHTRRVEANLACLVAFGVAAAGTFDALQGQPPRGHLDIDPTVAQYLSLAGCALVAILAIKLALTAPDPGPVMLRRALAVVSFVPVIFADPTYASLLVTIPLIDSRRRDLPPTRTWWTIGLLVAVAVLVVAEPTATAANSFESELALAIVFVVVFLLGDALRALDQGIETNKRLAALSERSRLAEELHDSLGHHLLASSVQLEKARALRTTDPASSATAVDHASQAVAEAIGETRLIVDTARGDEPLDVEPAIRELAQRIMPSDTSLDVNITGDHESIGPLTRVTIYRVVQEALTNLVRHSAATMAKITSTASADSIVVEIVDNGQGFDLDGASDTGGLVNMRRRVEELGGQFRIDSTLDGTSVTATMPR